MTAEEYRKLMKGSPIEWEFEYQLRKHKITDYEREYKFHPTRKWRLDFAWRDKRIAAEIEGGTYSGGRHTRGAGFEADCEKYNAATQMDWKVYRFTTSMVKSGYAINLIIEAIK